MTISVRGFQFQTTPGAPVLVCLILLFGIAQFGTWMGILAGGLLLLTLLIHEAAHALIAVLTRTPVYAIGISLKGTFIRRKKAATPALDLTIAAAGPATNIVLAMLLWNRAPLWHWLAILNGALALTNLAPIPGSDGQRILTNARQLRRHPPLEGPQESQPG